MQTTRPGVSLMDLLEMLQDADGSTWDRLAPKDRGRVRLMCVESRRLADQLISYICLNLDPPTLTDGDDRPYAAVAADHETRWRQAAAGRSAFLSRLPRLTELTVTRWPSDASLAGELVACGAAVRGRVTQLTLCGGDLSQHSIRAARLAFPQLDSLTLEDSGSDFGLSLEPYLHLSGFVFSPLHGAPWITKLVLRTELPIPELVLHSLAGVTTLQHLHLTLEDPDLHPPDLLHLTGLLGLESCTVDIDGCAPAMADYAALLASTRLTRLELLGDWPGQDRRTDYPDHDGRDAALALLGGLSRLQSLLLGHEISVDDATFAAIRRLTQLTELQVGDLPPLAPGTPGAHFPLLQQLQVGVPDGESPDPYLLPTLLSLVPLPSLRGINGDSLFVDVRYDAPSDEGGGAAWAATLHAVLHGLAASPLLGLEGGVCLSPVRDDRAPRSLAQLTEHLRPTAPGLLTCVTLHDLVMEAAPCGGLLGFWPGLRQLRLARCELEGGALPALVRGVGRTLKRLDVAGCRGAGVGEWVEVARQCCRPLQLKIIGEAAEVRQECDAVQAALFGVQNIQWL